MNSTDIFCTALNLPDPWFPKVPEETLDNQL